LLLVAGTSAIGILEGVELLVGVKEAGDVFGTKTELGAITEHW